MKVFFIGSAGPLSLQPFHFLLNAGHEICGVGLDRHQPPISQSLLASFSLKNTEAIEPLAQAAIIPLVTMNRPIAEVVGEVAAMKPDLLLVSCYERRLADELLAIPSLGAFNIHPSLLPAFRGPVPLFWQFRAGIEQFGLSLHRMSGQFDAGPVIASQSVQMLDGVTMAEATQRLAGQMKVLLDDGLPTIESELSGVEQNAAEASYQTFPEMHDFEVSVEWSARRVFNFMRATAHLGQPYHCEFEGRELRLRHALAYSTEGEHNITADARQVVKVACSTGTLVASYY